MQEFHIILCKKKSFEALLFITFGDVQFKPVRFITLKVNFL